MFLIKIKKHLLFSCIYLIIFYPKVKAQSTPDPKLMVTLINKEITLVDEEINDLEDKIGSLRKKGPLTLTDSEIASLEEYKGDRKIFLRLYDELKQKRESLKASLTLKNSASLTYKIKRIVKLIDVINYNEILSQGDYKLMAAIYNPFKIKKIPQDFKDFNNLKNIKKFTKLVKLLDKINNKYSYNTLTVVYFDSRNISYNDDAYIKDKKKRIEILEILKSIEQGLKLQLNPDSIKQLLKQRTRILWEPFIEDLQKDLQKTLINDNTNFDTGKYKLDKQQKRFLGNIAKKVSKRVKSMVKFSLEKKDTISLDLDINIDGYADEQIRPGVSLLERKKENKALSDKRALATKEYLNKEFDRLLPKNLNSVQLEYKFHSIGHGEDCPPNIDCEKRPSTYPADSRRRITLITSKIKLKILSIHK